MRISQIKNFKRKKELFTRAWVVLFIVCWVLSGHFSDKIGWGPKIKNAHAALQEVVMVQSITNTEGGSVTTLACTLSSGATAGNLIITAIATDKDATSYTVPSGFTLIQSYTSTNVSGALAYKIAAGGETTITWTQGSTRQKNCWAAEYSGLESSDVLDVSAENDSGTTAVTSLSSGTTAETAQADEFVLAFFTADSWDSVETRSYTNGFVEGVWYTGTTNYKAPVIIATTTVSSIGAQETTFSTTDTGDQLYGAIAAFKIASDTSIPGEPIFYSNDGGSNQIAFNNIKQNSTSPIFRLSATNASSTYDTMYIELNTSSSFVGTAYTQTFTGVYASGTAYNFTADSLSPSLPSTDGVTYFVRAKASGNGGSDYSDWSTSTWTYAYTSSGGPDWFQTLDEQFDLGSLSTTTASGNSVSVSGGGGGYVAEILSDSPTIYWKLDETSGTTAADASSNSNVGTYSGSYSLSQAALVDTGGTAVNFTGGVIDGGTALSSKADLSYEIWVKPNALPSTNQRMIIVEWGATSVGLTLGINDDNTFVAREASGDFEIGGGTAEVGELYHLVVTFDTSVDDVMTLYVNGSAVDSTSGLTSNASGSDGGGLGNESSPEVPAGYSAIGLNAVVDEFSGYVSELSAATVLSHYQAGISGAATGTIISPEIDFDDFNGATAWNEVTWSETEATGTVSMQVYYTDSTACDTIIPDGALSDNSTGFSSGPIDISGLDTGTYNQICLKSTIADNGGGSTLDDWGVSIQTGPAPGGAVSATSTQASSLDIPSGGQYIGGAFVIQNTSSTANVTSITITEAGTVDAAVGLDNIKLLYDLDTSGSYDCSTQSYSGSEDQYGDTDLDSFSVGNTSVFAGSVAVSSTQSMCVYVVMDITGSASADETIEIQITDPSSEVIISDGVTVSPGTTVSIDGATSLAMPPNLKQAHYRWRNDDGYESDFDVGDGADGSLTLSGDFNLNTSTTATYPDGVAYRVGDISGSDITLRNASGSTLVNTNGIAAGDEILLINMQGASGDYGSTGNYEFLEVSSVSGGVVTVSSAPTKDYDGSGDSFSTQKVFVQRVPNYVNVTTGAYNLTASAWDGGQDHDDSSATDNAYTGIVTFRASGIVAVSATGTINVDGLGFSGGAGITESGSLNYAYQGGSAGSSGAALQVANLGGGGGGYNDLIGASSSGGSGGGGGYATNGGAGDDSPEDASSGGAAGETYGDAALSQVFLGSGGGGGGSDNDGANDGTNGAAGGGIIMAIARYFTVVGTISSDGADSSGSGSQYYGTGGAGSGGSIYLASASSTLGSSLVTAAGGTGGCGDTGRCGGDGGAGRIRIAMSKYSGSTSPAASATGTPAGEVATSSFAFAEDTPYADMFMDTRKRLRFLVNNDGLDSGSLSYYLEFAKHADCSAGSYTRVPTDDSSDWKMSASSYISEGEATIDLTNALSNPSSQHWVTGSAHDETATSTAVSLGLEDFIEIEFAVEAVSGNASTGSQYCFRLTTDSETLTYTNYAVANMASTTGGDLTTDIVDSGGSSVTDPFIIFTTSTFSFASQTSTGTLGVTEQKIRVSNQTAGSSWTLTIAASSTTDLWAGLSDYYDFNDPTGDVGDGGDDDGYGGQMTIDPSIATITPQGGCALTGLTLGSSAAFSEGVTDAVTLLSAGGTADTGCYWDLTGIDISQTIPAEQNPDNYTLDMVITITAI